MGIASDYELEIHQRLLEDDAIAPSDLCEYLYLPLITFLKGVFPNVSRNNEELILEAASDALLNYIDNPSKYDPQRSSLEAYLKMSAKSDLKNSLAKETRRKNLFSTNQNNSVELFSNNRNSIIEATVEDPEQELIGSEITGQIQQLFPEKRDQELVDLILAGVRETQHYAEVLGICHLPKAEQQKEVKRAKDRINAKLKRANWDSYKP